MTARFPLQGSAFQLTAARRRLDVPPSDFVAWAKVSTHSRPKAAGVEEISLMAADKFQLTAARRRLVRLLRLGSLDTAFQLTAARRRLVLVQHHFLLHGVVSTHSRPKAAGPMT